MIKIHLMTPVRTAICSVAFSFVVGSSLMLAQDQPAGPPPPDSQQQSAPATGGWRKVGDQPPGQSTETPPPAPPADTAAPAPAAPAPATPAPAAPRTTMDPNYSQVPAPYPNSPYPNQPYLPYPNAQYPNAQYPNAQYPNAQYPNAQYPPPGYYNRGPIPAKLTLQPGTFITVRLNQMLSSDRNQAGDAFAVTLVKPVIVDGVVVAERGQTAGGKVVEAKKAGRVEGVSRLAVQLNDLTLSDGHPVPVQTQLYSRNGPTSVGRDVAAVGATTATGAAIGAAADWGRGAAIGAGAGALAGIIGVLVTRGRPTVLYPEEILTFRVEAPVTISTEAAPQAFRWVTPGDYDRPYDVQNRPPGPVYRYGYPYPYSYPYPYPYYVYSYPYWGPGFGFYWGPSFYWGGYWGRGWRR